MFINNLRFKSSQSFYDSPFDFFRLDFDDYSQLGTILQLYQNERINIDIMIIYDDRWDIPQLDIYTGERCLKPDTIIWLIPIKHKTLFPPKISNMYIYIKYIAPMVAKNFFEWIIDEPFSKMELMEIINWTECTHREKVLAKLLLSS